MGDTTGADVDFCCNANLLTVTPASTPYLAAESPEAKAFYEEIGTPTSDLGQG